MVRRRKASLTYRTSPTPQLNNLSTARSLISHIRKDDDLPEGWEPSKARRRSADDIVSLERELGRIHKIDQPRQLVKRNSDLQPCSPNLDSNFVNWGTMLFTSDEERRAKMNTGMKSEKEGWLASVRKRWRTSSRLSRRQFKDLMIKLRAHYNTMSGLQMFAEPGSIRRRGTETVRNLNAAMHDILRDTSSIVSILWSFLWFFLYWPLMFLAATLFLLQSFATGYTVTSEAYLNNFCQYKLPIVRDIVCSDWDQYQRPAHNGNLTTVSLTQPLDNLLQDEEINLAYRLPSYLAEYESRVRGFRVSLPESGYSTSDQEFFREKFTRYIDQSKFTVLISQQFYVHMVGTINYHISNTKSVTHSLHTNGILSPAPNTILPRLMTWLNSWYLVYLPVGIEPFQTTDISTNVRSISLMKEHIRVMKARLRKDIDLVITTKNGIGSLGQTSEEIEDYIGTRKSEIDQDNYADGKSFQQIGEKIWGKSYQSHQVELRIKWLDSMGSSFADMMKFLDMAETDFSLAYIVCQDFFEMLELAERTVEYGGEVPEWAKRMAETLDQGIKTLEVRMKSFTLEQLRFGKRFFYEADPEKKDD
ncbi:MAG: hypothetical protein Q9213_005461 [Squamulea squamosa]